jgi:uncharacterized protein YlzI (FlbEa/FlbD family)
MFIQVELEESNNTVFINSELIGMIKQDKSTGPTTLVMSWGTEVLVKQNVEKVMKRIKEVGNNKE